LLFGAANIHLWDYVPSANAYRQHLYQMVNGKMVWPSVNGPIPATWPELPAGKVGFYTIYPNPDQLLAGRLDARLRAFIRSAPQQGGVLTAYAEADARPGEGGQFAPLGLARARLHQVHAHLQALCHGSRVKYGAVLCGVSPAHVAFAIPGLDFYALDWYDAPDPPLFQALNQWRHNIETIQRSPVLAIAETNSNVPARRPYWFSAVFGWLKGYQLENGGRALGYWSYWHPLGPLSGPWLPDDIATIAALNSIGKDVPS
jgi:hypothetical protein